MAESHELHLLRPHRRRDDLPPLRHHADAMPLLPRLEVAVKHLVELLLCSTIGTYCLWRAASVLPRAMAEAHAVVRMAVERRREIEQLEEGVQ